MRGVNRPLFPQRRQDGPAFGLLSSDFPIVYGELPVIFEVPDARLAAGEPELRDEGVEVMGVAASGLRSLQGPSWGGAMAPQSARE
jgi:hypothetical protein